MHNKNNPLIIKILILTATLCISVSAMAADPAELVKLRDSFEIEKSQVKSENERRDLINSYIQQLTNLATDLRIYKKDREGTNSVRHEIRKAKKELKADLSLPQPKREPAKAQVPPKAEPKPVLLDRTPEAAPIAKPGPEPKPPKVTAAPKTKSAAGPESGLAETGTGPVPKREAKPQPKSAARKRAPEPEPKPVPKPVVTNAAKSTATPAPQPAVKKAAPQPRPLPAAEKKSAPHEKHSPRTHVSNEQGLAGPPEVNGKNVYSFELPAIGETTILAFWATGKESLDSYGKVWLITPEGHRNILGIWKESYLEKPSTEVYSHYNLKPIAEDITRKVTIPGTYKVEFEWTNGKDPLVIYRVEITS